MFLFFHHLFYKYAYKPTYILCGSILLSGHNVCCKHLGASEQYFNTSAWNLKYVADVTLLFNCNWRKPTILFYMHCVNENRTLNFLLFVNGKINEQWQHELYWTFHSWRWRQNKRRIRYVCIHKITLYSMSYQDCISIAVLFLATHSLHYLCELDGSSPFSSAASPSNMKNPVASRLKGCVEISAIKFQRTVCYSFITKEIVYKQHSLC
jgi:hypothetical protein